jgi:uncharacterized protein GlcG (DUF336 family)
MRASKQLQLHDARRMVDAAQCAARASGWAVAVTVCDAAGRVILFERDDDAMGIAVDLAPAKARTSALLGVPSARVEAALNQGFSALATMAGCALLGGAVEIRADSQVVGAIAVSGAPTGGDDEALARKGLAALAIA